MAKRFYEIAKKLEKPTAADSLVAAMKKAGINKSSVATLTDTEVSKIKGLEISSVATKKTKTKKAGINKSPVATLTDTEVSKIKGLEISSVATKKTKTKKAGVNKSPVGMLTDTEVSKIKGLEISSVATEETKMKKIVIGNGCVGCGVCVQTLPDYVKENDDGNAVAVIGKIVETANVKKAEKVCQQCQGKCFKLEDVESKNVHEIINEFKDKVKKFKIPEFTSSNFNYDVKQCHLSVPYSGRREYRYDFSSESSAKSAAESDFRPVYDSYKALVQEVAVQVKLKLLKPYYTNCDSPDSGYYVFNEQVRNMLVKTYLELRNAGIDVPENWKEFSVYFPENASRIKELNSKNGYMQSVEIFDQINFADRVWNEFRDGSYSSLSDYVDNMDFDSMETGETDFWGNDKEKYCYRDFHKACEEYVKDLKWAIGYVDIVETGRDRVNAALKDLESRMKKELQSKIDELDRYI